MRERLAIEHILRCMWSNISFQNLYPSHPLLVTTGSTQEGKYIYLEVYEFIGSFFFTEITPDQRYLVVISLWTCVNMGDPFVGVSSG